MTAIRNFLQGKKTYIVAVCFLVIVVLQPDQTLWEQVKEALLAAGLVALRLALTRLTGSP